MKRGFTLIEIIIAALILAVVSTLALYLYQRSNAAFSITLWKQERAAQAERFWTHLRRHLEAASDLLIIPDNQIGLPNPQLKKLENKPILVHSQPNSIGEEGKGNLLVWNVSTLNFDMTGSYAHSYKSEVFSLVKDNKRVCLIAEDGKRIAELDDVVSVTFDAKPITKANETHYESVIFSTVPEATVVGTLLEISISISPPESSIAKNIRIPHNHKFKLNVSAQPSTSPAY